MCKSLAYDYQTDILPNIFKRKTRLSYSPSCIGTDVQQISKNKSGTIYKFHVYKQQDLSPMYI